MERGGLDGIMARADDPSPTARRGRRRRESGGEPSAMASQHNISPSLLMLDGEKPVGLAALSYTWTLEHGGLVAWLDELYVVPERRCTQLGTALLDASRDVALGAGCAALELEVDSEHRRAESLYRRAGFVPLARSRWSLRLPSTTFRSESTT